jgi:hypothetical protein
MHVFRDEMYQVSGVELIRISSAGAITVLGTIPGSNRCIFADDGINLVITNGLAAYLYVGDTGAFTFIFNPNIETPNSVSYLNGSFLYDGDDGRFQASNVGAPGSVTALSVGIANSSGDVLLRGFAHDQLVYFAGPKSFEPWYYTGAGDLFFDRLDQGIVQVGLGALHSMADDVDGMYYLGSDRQFYRMSRSVAIPISTPSVALEVQGFDTVSDCIGWTFDMDGQRFYWATFPAESRSMLYSITLGYWVDLSYGMDGERHLANSHVFCYGKHYVADYRNGNIYHLDDQTYTDNGETILRYRDSAPITGGPLGFAGNRVIVGRLQLNVELGTGLTTGQGSQPEIFCRISGDGGKTFGPEDQVPLGVQGDYDYRVDYDKFADGYSIVYRIQITDPIKFAFWGGFVDVEDGGH